MLAAERVPWPEQEEAEERLVEVVPGGWGAYMGEAFYEWKKRGFGAANQRDPLAGGEVVRLAAQLRKYQELAPEKGAIYVVAVGWRKTEGGWSEGVPGLAYRRREVAVRKAMRLVGEGEARSAWVVRVTRKGITMRDDVFHKEERVEVFDRRGYGYEIDVETGIPRWRGTIWTLGDKSPGGKCCRSTLTKLVKKSEMIAYWSCKECGRNWGWKHRGYEVAEDNEEAVRAYAAHSVVTRRCLEINGRTFVDLAEAEEYCSQVVERCGLQIPERIQVRDGLTENEWGFEEGVVAGWAVIERGKIYLMPHGLTEKTVLHELAHMIVPPKIRHEREWVEAHVELARAIRGEEMAKEWERAYRLAEAEGYEREELIQERIREVEREIEHCKLQIVNIQARRPKGDEDADSSDEQMVMIPDFAGMRIEAIQKKIGSAEQKVKQWQERLELKAGERMAAGGVDRC